MIKHIVDKYFVKVYIEKPYLVKGKTITPLQALNWFGCMRLSGRIYDLKKDGWNIISRMIKLSSGKRVAQYRLA